MKVRWPDESCPQCHTFRECGCLTSSDLKWDIRMRDVVWTKFPIIKPVEDVPLPDL